MNHLNPSPQPNPIWQEKMDHLSEWMSQLTCLTNRSLSQTRTWDTTWLNPTREMCQ